MTGGVVESSAIAILDTRLGSIELKLDRLIRLEVHQQNHSIDIKRAFVRVEKIEDRLRDLEIALGEAAVRTSSNSGVITVFVSAAISIAVGVITWKVRGG